MAKLGISRADLDNKETAEVVMGEIIAFQAIK